MATYNDFQDFLNALDNAIGDTMLNGVDEYIKSEIQIAEEEKVYSYNPKFNSRRRADGGIQDRNNMETSYDDLSHTLTVTVNAPWQNVLRGGKTVTNIGAWLPNDLTDVIEKNGMYGAPPRPFTEEAEERLENGYIETLISAGINQRL